MQLLTILVFSSVLKVQSCIKVNLTQCISESKLRRRARHFSCEVPKVYHNIWDPSNQSYIERCFQRLRVPAGQMAIIDQISFHLHAQACPSEEYQPVSYMSNTQCGCKFKKSKCDKEGQKIYLNGSTIKDRTCYCDYEQGYVFNNSPSSIVFCQPKSDDCTCVCHFKAKKKNSQDKEGISEHIIIVPVILSVMILLIGIAFRRRIHSFIKSKCTKTKANNGESADEHNEVLVPENCQNENVVLPRDKLEELQNPGYGTDGNLYEDRLNKTLTTPSTPSLSGSTTTVHCSVSTYNFGEKVLAPLKGNCQEENILLPRYDLEDGLPTNQRCSTDDTDEVEHDIIIINVKDDLYDAIKYQGQLNKLNSKFGTRVTVNLLSRVLRSKDQFKDTIRSYRHIFLFLSSQFSIGKLETEIDISHLKECYFQDAFNVDRVKIIRYDNSVSMPDVFSGLNTFQNILASEAHLNETYLRMMEHYFRVMMLDRSPKQY